MGRVQARRFECLTQVLRAKTGPIMTEKQCPVAIVATEAAPRTKLSSYPEPFATRMAGREKRPLGDMYLVLQTLA